MHLDLYYVKVYQLNHLKACLLVYFEAACALKSAQAWERVMEFGENQGGNVLAQGTEETLMPSCPHLRKVSAPQTSAL